MTTTGRSLLDGGRVVGRLVWLESQLFEVVGRWVESTPEPRPKVLFATVSRHAAWRAEQLATLLPEVAGGPTRAELVAPGADEAAAIERLTGAAGTAARVRALCSDVVPWVVAAATAARDGSTAIADGAAARILGLVIADERADLDALVTDAT